MFDSEIFDGEPDDDFPSIEDAKQAIDILALGCIASTDKDEYLRTIKALILSRAVAIKNEAGAEG